MKNVELRAVADIVIERAQRFTDYHNVNVYIDYKEMIGKEELDAVIINLPHKLHKDATIQSQGQCFHLVIKKNPPTLVDVNPRFKRTVTSCVIPCLVTISFLGLLDPSRISISSGSNNRGFVLLCLVRFFFR